MYRDGWGKILWCKTKVFKKYKHTPAEGVKVQ